MRRFGYALWTAAGLYIILSCVWDEFSEMLGYWLPAISFAADNGIWWDLSSCACVPWCDHLFRGCRYWIPRTEPDSGLMETRTANLGRKVPGHHGNLRTLPGRPRARFILAPGYATQASFINCVGRVSSGADVFETDIYTHFAVLIAITGELG